MVYYYEIMKSRENKLVHGYFIEIGERIFEKKSEYQRIEVFSGPMGKVLVIDGVIQLSGIDEKLYHEPLVHIPLSFHPNPKKVLVLGGGDGCAVREILKHKEVEKVVLVDIDPVMVNDVGKGVLADMNEKALFDERVELRIEDAKKFVRETKDKFDVVFMDLVDPYDDFKFQLYSAEQINIYKGVLAEGGILSSHLEYLSPNNIACKLFAIMKKTFKYAHLYSHHVPSFNELWAFAMFSDGLDFVGEERKKKAKEKLASLKLEEISPEYIDTIYYLAKRYRKKIKEYEGKQVEMDVEHIPGTTSSVILEEGKKKI